MIVPHRSARSTHRVESSARPSMTVVSGSKRQDAIQRMIAVSTCSYSFAMGSNSHSPIREPMK